MPRREDEAPWSRLTLDPRQPLWPLVVFPVGILGVPWLVEVIGGWF